MAACSIIAAPSLARAEAGLPTAKQLLTGDATDSEVRQAIQVPPGNGATIADIQVRWVNANSAVVETRFGSDRMAAAFGLKPGDVYDSQRAIAGLTRLASSAESVALTLEPATEPEQVVLVITAEKPNEFFYGFGKFPRPTALQGPLRPETVSAGSNQADGFAISAYGGLANIGDRNQSATAGIIGGENTLGFEFDYTYQLGADAGVAVNFGNQRGIETEFDNGDRAVDLPNGDDPWVHRIGGGVEYFRTFSPSLNAALGLSYQRVSVRDDVFSSEIFTVDELGNPVTVSDSGRDDLLTLNLAGEVDRRDDSIDPTQGSRLLFGMDQSIPVGDANLLFNRISANYTQFVPLNLFGFGEGPRTLVLNVQGGTILGDAAPYEAFSLGGANSVRGYEDGELGTGRSFLQATAEYRFPVFSFSAFQQDAKVGGLLFFDYASDLGSGDAVIGTPAEARDKPGDGFGYGLGARAVTDIGTFRLEFGLNDEGDGNVTFSVGDRF